MKPNRPTRTAGSRRSPTSGSCRSRSSRTPDIGSPARMSPGRPQDPTAGRHYAGDAGAAYFSWQNSISGEMGGRLNARKFNAHLDPRATVVDFGCGAGYMLEQLEV